ncbi:MAG TPA: hypothetical protein VGF46_11925 [Gaiellales bacterium]|jgi:hypothetical protein
MNARRPIAALAVLTTLVTAVPAFAASGQERAMAVQVEQQMNLVAHRQHDTSFHAIAARCQKKSARLFLCEVKTSEPAIYGVRAIVSASGSVGWKLIAQLS